MQLAARLVSKISRRTEWTEGHVFAVAPEQFAVSDGIRTALAVAAMLAVAIHFDYPNAAFGAIAAFWTSMCDPLGPGRRRLRVMAAFALLGAFVVALASWGAHWGLWPSAATLFILTFACLLTRTFSPSFGPVPAQGGFLAAIAAIVGLASPQDVHGALSTGVCFLSGGLCMILLAIFPRPSRRTCASRLSVVAIFSRLDEMLGTLLDFEIQGEMDDHRWSKFDTLNRRAIRFAIERARETVARSADPSARYLLLTEAASKVFSAVVAIGHDLRKPGRRLGPGEEAAILQRLRDALRATLADMERDGDGKAVLSAAALLSDGLSGRTELLANATSFVAATLEDLGERWNERRVTTPESAASRFNIKVPSAVVWHSLRTSIAVLISHLVGIWLGLALPYWGAIATIVVMQPLTGNTWLRVLERGAGSILGGLIAAIAISAASSHFAMATMIVPLCAVVVALRLVNYGLFVVFLTPMFMLMTDYVHPFDGLLWERVLNEARGACIGIAAGLLLWPSRERQNVADAIGAAISANLAFASAVLRIKAPSGELDQLERDSGIASSRLETTYERLWLEGQGRTTSVSRLRAIIVTLRGVCGAAAAKKLTLSNAPGYEELARADGYERISGELQDSVRSSDGAPAGETDMIAVDDLDAWVQNLLSAVREYSGGPRRTART